MLTAANSDSDTRIKTNRANSLCLPQLTGSLSALISARVQPDYFIFFFYFMHQLIGCTAAGGPQSGRRVPVNLSLLWAIREHSTVGHFITIRHFPAFGRSCSHVSVCREHVIIQGKRVVFAFALLSQTSVGKTQLVQNKLK